MPTYSIIVPVYQSEDYIGECIESLLHQEGDCSWELLLVDNGSPDNSVAICESYAEKDSRIRIIHQENRGPGGGRNAGLREAAGEYVIFVDSDDFWKPNLLMTLESLRGSKPDIMAFSFVVCYETNKKTLKEEYKGIPVLPQGESGRDWLERLFAVSSMPHPGPWCYSYRREFLLENQLFYREELIGPEDYDLNMRAIPLARSVIGTDIPLYCWRLRTGSIMHSKVPAGYEWLLLQLSMFAETYRRLPAPPVARAFADHATLIGYLPAGMTTEVEAFIRSNWDIMDNLPPCPAKKLLLPLCYVFGICEGAKVYITLRNIRNSRYFR